MSRRFTAYPPAFVCLHDTAGAGDNPQRLISYLEGRGLSTHASITRRGGLALFRPLDEECVHVAGYNSASWGLDMHFRHGGYPLEPSATPANTFHAPHGGAAVPSRMISTPLPVQAELCYQFVLILGTLGSRGLHFPCMAARGAADVDLDRRAPYEKEGSLGVFAHRRTEPSHSDGAVWEAYTYARWCGLGITEALAWVRKFLTAGRLPRLDREPHS